MEGGLEQNYRKYVIFTLMILKFLTEIQSLKKVRECSDTERGNTESNISPRNKVLVKQTQNRDKMTPTFRPEPMTVKVKYRNSLTLDVHGVEYKRNITHFKKFLEKHDDPQEVKQNDVESNAIT